jgi:hypothetical protein
MASKQGQGQDSFIPQYANFAAIEEDYNLFLRGVRMEETR